MADPAILKRVRDLLARATDPGASEEEQRTSAHIAAKLCQKHGLLGELGEPAAGQTVTRARAEVVIDGVRTVVETISAARPGLDSLLGFDVFGFAQDLLRERAKASIEALRAPAPAAPRRRKGTLKRRKR